MPGSRRTFLKNALTGLSLSRAGLRNLAPLPNEGATPAPAQEDIHGAGQGASKPVWRIGLFNDSSGEFNSGVDPLTDELTIDYASENPVYVVGKSAPSDWFAFQPGSRNTSAGYRPHPFTVEFTLPDTPRGTYTLRVAILVEHPSIPHLEIDINGHKGWYYFHPILNYELGDIASAFFPAYGSDTIACELPPHFLRKGINRLVLTAVDEVPAEETGDNSQKGLDSGIVYDALQLEHDPAGEFQQAQITARTVPTIFYKMIEGRLHELVDVFLRVGAPARNGQVTLSVGEWTFAEKFGSDRDFGEYRIEVAVPEFESGAKAGIHVAVNGHSKELRAELAPAKKWNVFVVPHLHLDIGFTDYQNKVAEVQSRAVDKALDAIHADPGFRFSVDGGWVTEQFLAGRSEEQRQRLVEAVRQGNIFVPAQYANLLTGLPTLETLIRSLYSGRNFHSKYGGPLDYANITDVPSYTWSYASILAGAGFKYFAAGSNNHDAPILLLGRLHEKSPFWWEGPDGAKILMWYSRGYAQATSLFGMPFRIESGRDSLPLFLQIYDRPKYKSDATIVYGTQGDNQDFYSPQVDWVRTWNTSYAYPKLRFSGLAEAMRHIAEQAGDALPTFRGDGGPYWEEGAPSDARYVAANRRSERRALSAEKAATIGMLVDPHARPDRDAAGRMWKNLMLYDEHTWTYSLSVGDPEIDETTKQLQVKDSRATEASRQADYLLGRAMVAISDHLSRPAGTLVLFNLLSWNRSALVEIDLRKDLELVDLVSQRAVPYEELKVWRSFRRVRFFAREIPGMGYKCYMFGRRGGAPRIDSIPPTGWAAWSPGKSEIPGSRPISTTSKTTIDSPHYRLVLDPESGRVSSIFDKDLNAELVDDSQPYGFNSYVYVTGADQVPNRLIRFPNSAPPPMLEPHVAGDGRLVSLTREPFGTVARLLTSGVNTPRIETEIIVFNEQKKIRFTNRVLKIKVYRKEAVYFAFPFAMDRPQFRYDLQNGVVDPARDQLPGAGKEWFSVQNWVAVSQGRVTAAIVPVDAPLVALGDIVRGTWAQDFGTRPGTIFSFVMNNYWEDNYVAGQGGEFKFRYALTSGTNLQHSELSRLGWEEATPVEVNEITPNDRSRTIPQPPGEAAGSFVEINRPGVILVTWKLAEDGRDSIMRLLEVAGKDDVVGVQIPLLKISAAWRCDLLERNLEPLAVSSDGFTFPVKPFEIVTVRIEGTPRRARSEQA